MWKRERVAVHLQTRDSDRTKRREEAGELKKEGLTKGDQGVVTISDRTLAGD